MDQEKNPKVFLKTLIIVILTMFITAILILGGSALYIAKKNPFNVQACIISSFLKPNITADINTEGSPDINNTDVEKATDHPLLSNDQEKMIKDAGIDVETLPQTITPEMETCFIEKLGQERVDQIIGGSTLGPMDILKGSSCLN